MQLVVLNITDRQAQYAKSVQQALKKQGIRAVTDLRNEKIGFKIREHTMQRVPYMVIVGDREVETQKVAVRTRAGKDLGAMEVAELVEKLVIEIEHRDNSLMEDLKSA